MLTFDSVKLRLEREQSLSYMEFNYMILQAYDFFQLFKTKIVFYKLVVQTNGVILLMVLSLSEEYLKKESFGLTTPLITLASGSKMGKTEKGAVWLNDKMLSPYDYWQFWRNTDDRDVKKFLNYFTDIEPKEIIFY